MPLREAVELLGQAYVEQHPQVDADTLTVECLRYLYRLLFLFSVEARPELNYLPMNAVLYRGRVQSGKAPRPGAYCAP